MAGASLNVLVAGMHRSGTSAVGNLLAAAGLYAGPADAQMAPLPENPAGFAELQSVADFNDALLTSVGWLWDTPSQDYGALETVPDGLIERGKRLVRTNMREEPWFIKDPRLSLVLPAWRRILLDRIVVVVPIRPLAEVARSLSTRNGFTTSLGIALSSAYYRHLATGLSGLAMIAVDYVALSEHPREIAGHLLKALTDKGVTFDPNVDKAALAIRPALRRATGPSDTKKLAAQLQTIVPGWPAGPIVEFDRFDLLPNQPEDWEVDILGEHRRFRELSADFESRRTEMHRHAAEAQRLSAEVEHLGRQLATVEEDRGALAREIFEVKSTGLGRLAAKWVEYSERSPSRAAAIGKPAALALHVATLKPLRHRRPNPLFDRAWYLAEYPDIRESGVDPYKHYRRHGVREGRDPNAYFDTDWYLDKYPDVLRSGQDPLDHYLRYGASEGRDPSPWFNSEEYLKANPKAGASGVNPLLHYIRQSQTAEMADGRVVALPFVAGEHSWPKDAADETRPDGDSAGPAIVQAAVYRAIERMGAKPPAGEAKKAALLVEHLFDEAFYLARYPDVAASGEDPLVHYVNVGAAERRAPNPVFHVDGYWFDNLDVSDFEHNALLHYVLKGRHDGATPHPLFDAEWYANRYPDVRHARVDPYAHYLKVGRHEGRAGSAAMDEGTDIAQAEINLRRTDSEDVSIIVPVYGNFAMTYRALYSVAKRTPAFLNSRVTLADDYPERPLRPLFGDVEGLEIIDNPENLGFLRNCNHASLSARGEFLVFLNNDTVVDHGWLASMVALARSDPSIGIVGPKLLNMDGSLQEAGNVMFKDGWGYPYGRGDRADKPEYEFVRQVDCVTGACFLVRRDAFDEAGRFNEAFAPAFFEEYELAFAVANNGHKVLYQPASRVWHYGSASYGIAARDRQTAINHKRFVANWAESLDTRYKGPNDIFLARERPHARGTILVIDDRVPEYDKQAGALTIFQYLTLLARMDFKVVYLANDRDPRQPYANALQQMGIEVLYGDVDIPKWFAANGKHLDWVLLARPNVAPKYIDLVRRRSRARLLYYTHDLHFLREMRRYEMTGDWRALRESQRFKGSEGRIFRSVDCVLTPSSDEIPIIKSLAPDADVRELTPYFYASDGMAPNKSDDLAERQCVMFLGGFAHLPNVDAAVFLATRIMPLVWARVADARLLLVGSEPPAAVSHLAGQRVEVSGYVPDLAPWFARSRMSVSPLRFGSGVKGKIIASLQAGVPVITTTIGNEGIGLKAGEEALIADDEAGLAADIVRLFDDPGLLDTLAAAGRRVIAERFSEERARLDLATALGLPGTL